MWTVSCLKAWVNYRLQYTCHQIWALALFFAQSRGKQVAKIRRSIALTPRNSRIANSLIEKSANLRNLEEGRFGDHRQVTLVLYSTRTPYIYVVHMVWPLGNVQRRTKNGGWWPIGKVNRSVKMLAERQDRQILYVYCIGEQIYTVNEVHSIQYSCNIGKQRQEGQNTVV